MFSPTNPPILAPLFGAAPASYTPSTTPWLEALEHLRGDAAARAALEEIARGLAHPDHLAEVLHGLADNSAAFTGACRALQKVLEGRTP